MTITEKAKQNTMVENSIVANLLLYILLRNKKGEIMNLEDRVKQQLLIRGFSEKQLLNNRGLIGATIDESVLSVVKNLNVHDVIKSFPDDEAIEQWWAGELNQKDGFWQEAPYRTNGDVIEEIKTALKYFMETWQKV